MSSVYQKSASAWYTCMVTGNDTNCRTNFEDEIRDPLLWIYQTGNPIIITFFSLSC